MCQEWDEKQFNHYDLSHLSTLYLSSLPVRGVFYRFDKTICNTATYKRRPSSNYNSRFDEAERILANEEFGVTNGG